MSVFQGKLVRLSIRRHGLFTPSIRFVKLMVVLTAAWLVSICSPLRAQINWENTSSQNAWQHEVANWAGALVPGSTDVARFDEAGEYEVWWNALTASSAENAGQLRVEDGRVTLLNKENAGEQYQFNIKGTAADNDILISGPITHATVRGLHLHNEGDTQILGGATLTLDGSHAQGAQFTHLSTDKGFNLAGNLNVLSGAKLNGTGASIGHLTGSTGVATVSGSSSQWSLSGGTDVSAFLKNGLLVGDAGHGTLNIEGGGLVKQDSDFAVLNKVGVQAGSEGFVTITGKDSHWDMAADAPWQRGTLDIGTLGSGTVTVQSGGRLSMGSGAIGGSEASSMGLVTIAGEGSLWNLQNDLTVSATGTLNIEDGGMVNVTDTFLCGGNLTVHGPGSKMWANGLFFSVGGENGAMRIENGGLLQTKNGRDGVSISSVATVTGSDSRWFIDTPVMYVHGTLSVEGGGLVGVEKTNDIYGPLTVVVLEESSGPVGGATITGNGSQWNMPRSAIVVGRDGDGFMNVTEGGVVNSWETIIGNHAGSTGVVTVSGSGSQWNLGWYPGEMLRIGDEGHGTLVVRDGGVVSFDQYMMASIGLGAGSVGVVTVSGNGSHFRASDLAVGVSGHGTLKVQDGGLVSVHGVTEIGTGSVVHVDGGRFEFGRMSWDEFSSIQADHGSMAGVVTLHGNSAIDSLHAFRNSGVELFDVQVYNHGTLQGQGAVDVGVLNHGTIDVKAGEQLQFSGRGSMNLSEIKNAGGEIRFQHGLVNRHGGLIEGHGQFMADADDGWTNEGLIQMTGDAEIHGDLKNSFSGSDTTDIGIHISNGHTVTFHDDVTMVAGNRNVAIGEDGYAVFRGSYNGGAEGPGAVQMLGDLRPGNSAGAVRFEGDLQMGQSSTTSLELGGVFDGGGDRSLTEFDWIDAMGNVELAGALDVLLIDSFELAARMSFEILKVGGTLTGQYDGLDEGRMVGSFSGTNLYITYAGGEGSSVTLFSRAVPEPAALLLALFGLALVPRRRRR